MIKARLLPDAVDRVINVEKIRARDLLKILGFEEDEALIIKNGRLVSDLDEIIQANDDVKVVREAIGG